MRFRSLLHRLMFAVALIATVAAPSAQTIESLAAKQYRDFDDLRTLFGRFYVHTLFAGLKEACPSYPDALPPPALDVVEYIQYRSIGQPDVNKAFEALGVSVEMDIYAAAHDGPREIKALAREQGCARSVHAAWIAGARHYLEEKELGGAVQNELNQACEASTSGGDCGCFAKQFDWESTPGQRKAVLESKVKVDALRKLVRDSETRQRLSYRCAKLPNFGNAKVAASNRTISSGRYEWYVRMRQTRPSPFVCAFHPTRTPNQFIVRYAQGFGSRETSGSVVQDGSAVTFSWDRAPAMPTDWQLTENGGMKSSVDPKWRIEYVLGPPAVK